MTERSGQWASHTVPVPPSLLTIIVITVFCHSYHDSSHGQLIFPAPGIRGPRLHAFQFCRHETQIFFLQWTALSHPSVIQRKPEERPSFTSSIPFIHSRQDTGAPRSPHPPPELPRWRSRTDSRPLSDHRSREASLSNPPSLDDDDLTVLPGFWRTTWTP